MVDGFETVKAQEQEEGWEITLAPHAATAACPLCGERSQKVHSTYVRKVRDLPVGDRSVQLMICARKFKCVNAECAQKIFCERLTDFVVVRGQRSNRLTGLYRAIGFAASAQAGARLTAQIKALTSADTLIRIVRATTLAPAKALAVIGVDDWALKKGQSYGTVIVDHESGRPVDMIEGRTSIALTDWLKPHSDLGIKVVTRDRSTEYIRAITESLPQAVQVADRWHLLQNIREAVQRLLTRQHAEIVQAYKDTATVTTTGPLVESANVATSLANANAHPVIPALTILNPKLSRSVAERAGSLSSRVCRQQRFEQVQALKANGGTIRQIARLMDLSRSTARKYFYAESFPERRPNRRVKSFLDAFVHHLQQRFDAGCRNASQLWREVRDLGFTGSTKQVRRWVYLRRETLAPTTAKLYRQSAADQIKAARTWIVDLPSTKQLAWLFVKPRTALSDQDDQLLTRLLQNQRLNQIYQRTQQFCTLVKSHTVEALDTWLDDCAASELSDLVSFAAGIRADYAAVKAALAMPWSNGHVAYCTSSLVSD